MDARKWFDLTKIDPEEIYTYTIGGRKVDSDELWKVASEYCKRDIELWHEITQICQEACTGITYEGPEPERKPLEDGPDLPFWDEGDEDEELDDFARDEVWRD